MNKETNFLTRYGLRHYVTSAKNLDAPVFSIDSSESAKMIRHARNIIHEMYDGPVTILTV
ncbi:MAG: hypothetical protein RIC16_12290 [Rhodospirillales bacterium]